MKRGDRESGSLKKIRNEGTSISRKEHRMFA